MPKGAGKGKISNDLVAASCAAVLAVYAAGYSRTRDAARKFETQAKERRLAVRLPAPQPRSEHEVPATTASATTTLTGPSPPASTPNAVHHRTASAARAAAEVPRTIAGHVHEPATDTSAPAMAAETGPPSPVAPQAIAPVPLPSEIESASVPVAAVPESAAVPAAKWRDGVYTGMGDSPHGDIEARVVIKNGRIVEAGIATCETRYPCSVIDSIVHQPVLLQSPTVDYVSHATESSYAYYYGLVDALKQALEQPPGEAPVAK